MDKVKALAFRYGAELSDKAEAIGLLVVYVGIIFNQKILGA